MPSVDTQIGPLPIPAPVGATDAFFDDQTASQLLDYCAFWLSWGLDGKVGSMTSPPVASAIPPANRYTNSPNDVYLTRKLPALFVFWNGQSKIQQYSTIRSTRYRDFSVLYVFERVKNPEHVNQWSGLISTADAILARAFERMAHANYAYPGSPFAPGANLRDMFQWQGAEYLGGSSGFLKELGTDNIRKLANGPTGRAAPQAQGGIQQGYPTLSAGVRVFEEIGQDTLLDPQDVNRDIQATIQTAEYGDPVTILERVLVAPDGSEQDGGT